jgi:hypothetical protein
LAVVLPILPGTRGTAIPLLITDDRLLEPTGFQTSVRQIIPDSPLQVAIHPHFIIGSPLESLQMVNH